VFFLSGRPKFTIKTYKPVGSDITASIIIDFVHIQPVAPSGNCWSN